MDNRATLHTKLRGALAQLRYLPRVFALVRAAAGGWTAAWIALLVVQGLLPIAVVYLTRDLVDALAAAIASRDGWAAFAPTATLAVAMGVVLLLAEALHRGADWVRSVQARRVEDHLSALVHAKSSSVDLGFYESPDSHDHLHRARAEAAYRPVALLESGGGLLQNGITLVAMAAVLIPYGWWMPIALLLSTLPALWVVLRFAIRQHRWRQGVTEDERRAAYHDWLLTSGEAAAEIRLFGLGPFLSSAYQSIQARLRREELRLSKAQGLAELAAGIAALLISAACLAWMAWRAMNGAATLGDLALFYQAFSQGQRLMRSLLGSIGHVYYNVLFLGNLFHFLDFKSEVVDPPAPRRAPAATAGLDIQFNDVTFRYPGSDRIALEGLRLSIPAGQVAAVVGTNGAGKSTLLKLLCRFYDPQEGAIELGGIDLRELSLEDLRAMITVLFQEPVNYNATVAENIALHPAGAPPTRSEIVAAARAAGADELIERLPQGYETPLGKWFTGGVELSTGEWQRVALARAFVRPAPVILLDEPTSAMDSWAEGDWLRRFRSLARGRTAIIVTHRFTTAMQADVIYVMKDGKVDEFGSHARLLELGGAYAQSWRAQMRAEQGIPVRS